jgi:hypothetical protein
MKYIFYWIVPFILLALSVGIEKKQETGEIVENILLLLCFPTIFAFVFVIRQYEPPFYNELTVHIDYDTGYITTISETGLESTKHISYFGRIVKHKEGIKFFKKGFRSYESYITNYSNLNRRDWNMFLPSILYDFDEIEVNLRNNNWL